MPLPESKLPETPATSWIGVDVGGSGARACVVAEGEGLLFAGEPVTIDWPEGEWRPLPLAEQLAEPPPPIESEERAEGARRVEQLAGAIETLAGAAELRVALAVPGLWTPDARGIAAWRNGPRLPGLLDALEERLGTDRITMASDGPAGALGELHGRGGALRETLHGWYLAGGSGLAEAAIVGGEVVPLGGELKKAWELEGGSGRSFEDLLAPRRINEEWVRRCGGGAGAGRPERRAAEGDPLARELMAEIGGRLAEYVERRTADYRRVFAAELERVVIGQRSVPLLSGLELPPRVRLSGLRLAPALGAVAAARSSARRRG